MTTKTKAPTEAKIIDWLDAARARPMATMHKLLCDFHSDGSKLYALDGCRAHVYTGTLSLAPAATPDWFIERLQSEFAKFEAAPHVAQIDRKTLLTQLPPRGEIAMRFMPDTLGVTGFDPDKILFRLNPAYVKAALRIMPDTITVRFGSADDAVLFTAEQFAAFIMPMTGD